MQANSPTKVERVREILKDKILQGIWPVGSLIPTEDELGVELKCSRPTISKAISNLAHEGLVERRKRAGTKVLTNSPKRSRSLVELDAFAFIYPSDRHENLWKIAQGFQGQAISFQRRSILFPTGADFEKEAEIISRLDEFDIRGAVIYPMISRPEEEITLIKLVSSSKFPLVIIGQPLPGCLCPTISQDGFHLGHTMTKHLIQTGVTRIGFFANGAYEMTRRDIYKGYLWALEEAGISVDRNLSFLEATLHADFNDPLREPTELARTYLKTSKGMEAVVCADDFLALGLMRAARELGMRLPDDLKITGIDDISLAASSAPPLTTYRISAEDVGRIAFQTLNDHILSPTKVPLSVPVRGEIVVRESA